jgi:hypothetical protein
MRSRTVARLLVLLMALGQSWDVLLAAGHAGRVTLAGRAVPGATVTATQGDRHVVTSTDGDGNYVLPDLPDGQWTVRVEMRGFTPQTKEVTVAADAMPSTFELTMLPVEDITRSTVPVPALAPLPPSATPAARAAATAAPSRTTTPAPADSSRPAPQPTRPLTQAVSSATAAAPIDEPRPPDAATGAADGFIIAGSVNNGASSPFAQSAAFGNYRPGQSRNPYRTQLMFSGTAPFLNATPYGAQEKPDATSFNMSATLAGPLQFPGITKRGPQFTLSFQRNATDNFTSLLTIVPTAAERAGDFSQSAPIIDPTTGLPFAGNQIPANRISGQAAALLDYYPLPNVDSLGRNYQTSLASSTRSSGFTFNTGRSIINNRNNVTGTTSYNRSSTHNSSLFGFSDRSIGSNLGLSGTWTNRISPFLQLRVQHSFQRSKSEGLPFFANVRNVSGDAGIIGNDQESANWGPPTLSFISGITGLSDSTFSSRRTIRNFTQVDTNWTRGRHNFQFGGTMTANDIDAITQANSRGQFLFTGSATHSDLADFLLGLPQSSSLALGNADQGFRAWSYAAYVQDDFRIKPFLTLNLGLRWEYEAPVSEILDRLVNLDIAPGFTAVTPVLASQPVGPLTGQRYPSTLVRGDIGGFQPRLSMAWRPILGSSLLVRGGYDLTRSSGIAMTLANLMSQQPPLAITGNAKATPEHPLSLADGFVASPDITQNTFAVDPDLRVPVAQNWQIFVQRDVPASMTVAASYLGTHGSNLTQQFFPNTYPAGVESPCPTCPSGFRYVTSHGSSHRDAMRLEWRRRQRNGLTASAQYTLSKATDDSSGFTDVNGASTAQNWLDLHAERGPSAFDQRHVFGAQVTYNTGVGLRGGAFLSGFKGKLVRGWTIDTRLTMGSGMPFTPIVIGPTASAPALRASLSGDSLTAPGYYANPAAYVVPAPGTFGNAGRNSARRPGTFSLDGSLQRSFPRGRLNFDLRIDATNLLNRVVATDVVYLINSPQFGLPTTFGSMRRINTRLNVRF